IVAYPKKPTDCTKNKYKNHSQCTATSTSTSTETPFPLKMALIFIENKKISSDAYILSHSVAENLLKGWDVEYATYGEINKKLDSSIDLYVQPGSNGATYNIMKKFKSKGEEKTIENWVNNGGKYLGLCMGAFLAMGYKSGPSAPYDPGFGFVFQDNDELWELSRIGLLEVQDSVKIFVEDGPRILASQLDEQEIYSKFPKDYFSEAKGTLVNSFIKKVNQGWVGLVAGHYEADNGKLAGHQYLDWEIDNYSNELMLENWRIGTDFIKELMKK
ncbi:hypothetical protein HK099_002287, partial [Clydaea vesicula]